MICHTVTTRSPKSICTDDTRVVSLRAWMMFCSITKMKTLADRLFVSRWCNVNVFRNNYEKLRVGEFLFSPSNLQRNIRWHTQPDHAALCWAERPLRGIAFRQTAETNTTETLPNSSCWFLSRAQTQRATFQTLLKDMSYGYIFACPWDFVYTILFTLLCVNELNLRSHLICFIIADTFF